MLGIHIHCLTMVRKGLVLQRPRKEHQLTFGSLIQLTASLHQENGLYPTHMTYLHQSIIMEAKCCIIPDFRNMKNMRKGRQKEVWGTKDTNHEENMVRMLYDDEYGADTKMHMVQSKCRSSFHSSCLISMM